MIDEMSAKEEIDQELFEDHDALQIMDQIEGEYKYMHVTREDYQDSL